MERVAIATLAALATQGGNTRTAFAAVVIFLVVVAIEELGKRWTWHGQRVTLRDVALSSVGDLRIQLRKRRKRPRRRRRRAKARAVGGGEVAASRDST